MIDLSATIAPKVDQLTADDLIAGPRTVTITKVTPGKSPEQPICIFFEGDNGKPYRPGLSMRRVLVHLWKRDGNAYVGRSMTLYRDEKVKWGGMEVGGIRISHMTHIEKKASIALTETKGSKKLHVVNILKVDAPSSASNNSTDQMPAAEIAIDRQAKATADLIARIQACPDQDALDAIAEDRPISDWRAKLAEKRPELADQIKQAFMARFSELTPPDDEPPLVDEPPPYEPAPADQVPA